MVEYAREKARRVRRLADGVRPDAACRKERPEPFRFLGDEAKRLNCKRFRRFPGLCRRALHAVPFAFLKYIGARFLNVAHRRCKAILPLWRVSLSRRVRRALQALGKGHPGWPRPS